VVRRWHADLVQQAAAVLEGREKPSTYSSRRPGRQVPTIVDQGALCEAKGMSFQPHELAPWEVPAEGEPDHTYPPGHGVRKQWPMAQRLRRELEAELAAEDGR
jgi:hypothetical protein